MDGLSVAASIAGLVSIADIVVRRGYKYVRDVKDAEKSVAVLIGEVNKLSDIIQSLENVARQCEDEKYKIEPTTQVHQIEACLKTLQSIEMHLKESDLATATKNSDRIKRKLQWSLNKSKVKELMLEVESHQSAMGLAMKASGMFLLNLLAGQHEVHNTLLQLRRDIKDDRVERAKVTMTDQRKKWFQVLGNVEVQRWQNSNIKLTQPGTGVWFTDGSEFKDWLTTDSGRLWMYSIPGAGKTILMSMAIQEAQKYTSQSRALAFFYCDYKDPLTHNPVNIIGSLVKQLTMQNPELCFKVIKQ